MKNSLDKYSKAGSLSLHLQKYELSPKFNHAYQKSSQIQSEEIVYTSVESQNREAKILVKSISKEKGRSQSIQKYQKSPSIKFANEKSNTQSQFQDEDQLFNRCMNLTSRIELLKKQKLECAFHQFEQQQRKKMEYQLQKQKKAINFKYTEKRAELKSSYQKQANRITKTLQDINKLKSAYSSIFQDLVDRRNKVNKQYQISLQRAQQLKEKLISQWKRSSNQEIMKKTNKQF